MSQFVEQLNQALRTTNFSLGTMLGTIGLWAGVYQHKQPAIKLMGDRTLPCHKHVKYFIVSHLQYSSHH